MAGKAVTDLLEQARNVLESHMPPLKLCTDCGRTFTDELAHACHGFWQGSFGNFVPDERDPKRLANGYAVT